MENKTIPNLLTLGVFLLATFFRLYGVNWDQNQHLHPDERFLTMVATGISWPKSFHEYLDTASSPLNPHNRGFGFFVYGTFPVFFTKWVAESLNLGDYNNLTIVGRQLSALFDLGTVILVFLIAKQIVETRKKQLTINNQQLTILFPLLSMFFYATMVLPIQLSHFYAVETYLTFFITLSFYLLTRIIKSPNQPTTNNQQLISNNYFLSTLLGISFGLALASKITAVLFLPIISFGFLCFLMKNKHFFLFFAYCSLFFVSMYFTLRLAQPYLFANPNIFDVTLNQKILNNWKELKSFDDPSGGFPPAVQWITTKSYIFPLKNMIFWGLGLPLGILSIFAAGYQILSIMYQISRLTKRKYLILNTYYLIPSLSILWILILFIYQGGQFVKALRYFFQIYPFLALLSGWFLVQCFGWIKKYISQKIYLFPVFCYLLSVILYPLSFISIYAKPITRVTASLWVYQNIPAGSTLSSEEWDDGLPLSLGNLIHEKYKGMQFPLYWPDSREKWEKISGDLKKTDYIILTSNRLYGSIMTYPQKYPVSIKFYNSLFDGSLGFKKVAEFTSRPNIPIPGINICLTPPFVRYGIVALPSQECPLAGISFVDDYADETFTVYDHPKVIIFKKERSVDYYGLLNQ